MTLALFWKLVVAISFIIVGVSTIIDGLKTGKGLKDKPPSIEEKSDKM